MMMMIVRFVSPVAFILRFKVERSAVENVLDSLLRSRLIGLEYSSGYHRVH